MDRWTAWTGGKMWKNGRVKECNEKNMERWREREKNIRRCGGVETWKSLNKGSRRVEETMYV